MLQALMEAAIDGVHDAHRMRPRVEGRPQDGWLLADFGDVILHIFSPDRRAYYGLEELWDQAKVLVRLQ